MDIFDQITGETIYSKRYPPPDVPPTKNYSNVFRDMPPAERTNALSKLLNGMLADSLAPPSPRRLAQSKKFIDRAKALAEAGRIDIDIHRDNDSIDVHLYFPPNTYLCELGTPLAELLEISDDIALSPRGPHICLTLGFTLWD